MADNDIKWTRQQKRAIKEHCKDVLVTASAGTGKTAVLSGRFVDVLCDKSVCPDVRNILVLTFTELAAEQMRQRITDQLKTEFLKTSDVHLRYQQMMLGAADISTIHSFCKRLITEHFHKLGLDPTFRVIESDEQKLLKSEILEKTIEWAWRQSHLQQGLKQLLYKRDLRTGDGFLSKIIDINDFLESVVHRKDWYQRTELLSAAIDSSNGETGKKQKQFVSDKLNSIIDQLRGTQKICREADWGGDWHLRCEEHYIQPVVECINFLKAGDWESCAERIRNYKKPTIYRPRETSEVVADLAYNKVKKALGVFEQLGELAVVNPDYLDVVGRTAGLQTKVIVELVRKFQQFYSQAKKIANCMDFADLERYALELLSKDENQVGGHLPSDTALALRERYKYIFVDEYQDINAVQQAILELIGDGGNIFVVGDVKQSIYAFRGAKPEIFLEHLKSTSVKTEKAKKGLRVDLTANFRSTRGILDFVNKVFGRIMTNSFAGIDYDESAKLKAAVSDRAGKPAADSKPSVELHILDKKSKSDSAVNRDNQHRPGDIQSLYSNRQLQAIMIAQRIRRMVGTNTGEAEFDIFDKQSGKSRPVEYRDIVILMRSPAKRIDDYVQMLRLAGVPVSCQNTGTYLEHTEITDMLCLLKVLDNPQRDIELAAVLRSPLFKISDSELAKIKVFNNGETQDWNFYHSVVQYSKSGGEKRLSERLKKSLSTIENWRSIGRRGRLADLIWQIYRETNFPSYVLALPNGRQRHFNLLKLHDRAIQFEGFASGNSIPSLKRFVEFLEKLKESGGEWLSTEPAAESKDAVRIMSIHKSKGLEFPVVFLAELNGLFNKTDLQADIIVDVDDTLGLQIIDRQTNAKLSSLIHQVIAEKKLAATLAEEMRILYVATTRARDKLILTASKKISNCCQIICDGFFFGGERIGNSQLLSSGSYLEWLLYGLSDQENLHQCLESGLEVQPVGGDLFGVQLYRQAELDSLSKSIEKLKEKSSSRRQVSKGNLQSGQLEGIKKSLSWRYRFGDVTKFAAKCSVTQLTHHSDEYVKSDYSRALEMRPASIIPGRSDSSLAVDGRVIGTATHLVIARLDLSKPVTTQAIEKIKEKLLLKGAITEPAAQCINTESIAGFFETKPGRAAIDANNAVHREWMFSLALPASWSDSAQTLKPLTDEDESIIVQGIIDMLIQTPKGLLVIDFKTDGITAEQVDERVGCYRRQIELYGLAGKTILKAKSVSKWLYFLSPGCAVEIE